MTEFMNFIVTRSDQIINLVGEHIFLSFIAVLIAILIGVPLGIIITRVEKLSKPILGFANLVQAIPSLAILGFLIPFVGIGQKPAIIMVVIYSLLPIIKNTYTGLVNIDKDTIEAAKGIGLTNKQILTKVQLPLAFPVIMAGIRISAVTAVGLMTIAAFVGAGGLGYLVFSGVQTVDNYMILAGAIPACILALLMDFVLGKAENRLHYKNKRKNNKINNKTLVATGLIIVLATFIFTFGNTTEDKKITIGSKNFTESIILGNMLADLIESHTDLKVERKLNLGGTQVVFGALNSGDVDLYVEYTGTGLVNILKKETITNPQEVYDIVKREFKEKYDLKWLKPLGFNNTYAIAVRKDTADKYGLKTISDLRKASNELIMGPTIEFSNRPDGLIGLNEKYDLTYKSVSPVDGGLRYTAINNRKSDIIDAFSTDGLLKAFDLVVLEDDKNFFPPYYAVPLITQKTLNKYPELEDVINKLAGRLDDEKMRELNYRVDELKESPENVARDFLIKEGLIEK